MEKRNFGNTGEKISPLGFGCMRFPEYQEGEKWFIDEEKTTEMIAYAYENGVNYFDTAPYYCNSNSEIAVGKGVKPFRDKILLSTKSPCAGFKESGDFLKNLEISLKKLDTSYVDFYHFWGIGKGIFDDKILKLGLLEEAQKAKEQGLIRHISFSFHDDPSVIKYIIDKSKEVGIPMESMLCQYNMLDRGNEEMLAYAKANGVGTVAMGPVAGGRLSAPTEFIKKIIGDKPFASYELAFRFCLANKNLDCALSGMENLTMVKQNIEVTNKHKEFTEKEAMELANAVENLKKFSELYCTGCKYCQPCPAGIDIPHIFTAYTHLNVYGLKDYAKGMMRDYKNSGRKPFSECKNCGLCESKCPQKIKIRAELERVEKILLEL